MGPVLGALLWTASSEAAGDELVTNVTVIMLAERIYQRVYEA